MKKQPQLWNAFCKLFHIFTKIVSYIATLSQVFKGFLTYIFIRLDNILIGDINDLTTVKLADFGLSAKYDHVSFTNLDQHVGTLIFMAPEVALTKQYSKSVDLWSTGIIMFMLLTGGKHPVYTPDDSPESYKNKL